MSQNGYIVVANIFGYTNFLNQTELDHAQSIIDDLLNTLIENIQPPLIFSKTESDSIFVYTPENSFIQNQTFMEAIENLYCLFVLTRETMHRNTVCPCKACKFMSDLDLKFVLHYGTYSFTTINGQQDLIGADVMTIRHLSKSPISDTTGVKGFAFITNICVQAMKIDDFAKSLKTYSESHEHIGIINGFIYDLYPVWEVMREKNKITVKPEDAWFVIDTFLPVTSALAWDYITEPGYRRWWLKASRITLDGNDKGRIGIGTTYICAHGRYKINQVIVDWRPFEYLTVDTVMPLKGIQRSTVKLTPDGNGTKISWLFERVTGLNSIHTFLLRTLFVSFKGLLINRLKQGSDSLQEVIKSEIGK
ncbi:MAG: DUF2652 domain-containing protein [Thermodesulfobacteriota bacterium]